IAPTPFLAILRRDFLLLDPAKIGHAGGVHRAGIDAADTYAITHACSAQRVREIYQRSIGRGAANIARVGHLTAGADHVYDHTAAARAHRTIHNPRDADISEKLEVP